ncbi:MAG: glycoside hydrolase family 2 [Tenericutes bacterium GWF2_57_13]|nr:MAG: glycoside hydrolase family 2 [Tenericutes bacterium GWF2_57_13]
MRRSEYPRPDFVRPLWHHLNGPWEFLFDDDDRGHAERWYENAAFDRTIEVPFCFQSPLSGIHDESFHDRVWYRRTVEVPNTFLGKRIILHIGACDYESEVYAGGVLVARHIGGTTGFSADVTDRVEDGNLTIVVFALDPSTDETIPRGKQYWKELHEIIWYPRTTGIWQTVWLEAVSDVSLDHVKVVPDFDAGTVTFDARLSRRVDAILAVEIYAEGKPYASERMTIARGHGSVSVAMNRPNADVHPWSPEDPFLYDVVYTLHHRGSCVDRVTSYLGMRKIHTEGGRVFLNNHPYYLRLVLDQGYWEAGLLTAPSDADFLTDIKLAKSMGFNGARKHQKVEDPRYLYHADKQGFLVWGEIANAARYSKQGGAALKREFAAAVKRDAAHPCIVAWVPLNESWGVPEIARSLEQQRYATALYRFVKKLDPSRPVVMNDGWEMTETDLCAIHNYSHGEDTEPDKQARFRQALSTKEEILSFEPAGRAIYVGGYAHRGEPILLTEFGGIAFKRDADGWGYTTASDQEGLIKTYGRLLSDIASSQVLAGYCYTQLTDVFQEKNGLLTFDRRPKAPVDLIQRLNRLPAKTHKTE